MAGQRTTFGKLQRERAKKAKAAAKRERRQNRDGDGELTPDDGDSLVDTVVDTRPELSSADVLERLETVHQQFDAGIISYDQFAESKEELLSRLQID